MLIRIGIAGWSLTAKMKAELPEVGSHLERYATRFHCVEINSSFYRPHRRTTYERWADSVLDAFRFSVKVPKVVTHERRLSDCDPELGRFLEESSGLKNKLGVFLVQLPPSFQFDRATCKTFFTSLRSRSQIPIVVEPRHATWFTDQCDAILKDLDVGRVAADPGLLPIAGEPGGSRRVRYFRLHGSPDMYYSNYSDDELRAWLQKMNGANSGECWCIFDNTAAGAAFHNAGTLQQFEQAELERAKP
jgi:uncharacterized protein YecE (DUF72 family)